MTQDYFKNSNTNEYSSVVQNVVNPILNSMDFKNGIGGFNIFRQYF